MKKEYKERLKEYAKHIEICGEKRGSYSKTDASDMDCFVPYTDTNSICFFVMPIFLQHWQLTPAMV